MKYIMVAKNYLNYHPKAGQPTGFRESILSGRKVHTIRATAGNKKTGDTVSLRQWEGKPYASKQVEFAQCEIKITPIVITPLILQMDLERIADFDGFDHTKDFIDWFTGGKTDQLHFEGVCIWFRNVRAIAKKTKE